MTFKGLFQPKLLHDFKKKSGVPVRITGWENRRGQAGAHSERCCVSQHEWRGGEAILDMD